MCRPRRTRGADSRVRSVGAFIPIISLLVVLTVGMLITRIAAVALTLTGLSRDLARFQARSAYVGVGFTTSESEHVLAHPVRRRIIMWLMLLGNAGFVAAISSLLPMFVGSGEDSLSFLNRILILASGLMLLWAFSSSQMVDRWLSRMIGWALGHWTTLAVYDFSALLQLSAGFAVGELKIEEGDWVAGKSLGELRLADEGVHVLGIRRRDGQYVGAPVGLTFIRPEDTLVLYGKAEHIAELSRRRADKTGDLAHTMRVREQTIVMQQQEAVERTLAGASADTKNL